jgi:SAM-dependent methyltransferase
MIGISENYRRLDPAEVPALAAELADAWLDPSIPQLQYDMAVKDELKAMRDGKPCAPFAALARCFEKFYFRQNGWSLLDVGASGGYYNEVLRSGLGAVGVDYTGIDFSPSFKELAERLYPGIKFDVGDARSLPYPENSFEIVLSGCCLLHIPEYEAVIRETARVASRYAIFNKTPIILNGETEFYVKTGYGVPMIEIYFAENELLGLFSKYGLELIFTEDVSRNQSSSTVHRTYLLSKHW